MKKSILVIFLILVIGFSVWFYQKNNNQIETKKVEVQKEVQEKNKKEEKVTEAKNEIKNNEDPDKKELEERMKRLGIKVIKVKAPEWDEKKYYDETVFPNIEPIKNLQEWDREYFKISIEETLKDNITPENIMKAFPGIKKEDFKNTGKLKYQVDYDILLNNILVRLGLEPQNGEHLDSIIEDLRNDGFE